MKRKILPRIFVVILTATLISTMLVSSIFAKYVTSARSGAGSGRPAAFGVEFSGIDTDRITINLAQDGEPAPVTGYFKQTYEIPFSLKCDANSEVDAAVTLKIDFDYDNFGKNITEIPIAGTGGATRTFGFRVYKYDKDSKSYVELSRKETNNIDKQKTWTAATPDTVLKGTEVAYKIELDFYYENASAQPASFTNFISDAMQINVIAKSVDP